MNTDCVSAGDSSTERLRELIAAKLRDAGRSHRWAERMLKLGHGTVANILAGRTAFRFEYLDLFAGLFETTPATLLAEAEGKNTLIAKIKLRDKVGPELKRIQAYVVDLRSEIQVSPREDAMLEGDEAEDVETAMRSLLDCLIHQHLAAAIEAAEDAAAFRPPRAN